MNIGILEDNPAILEWLTIALELQGHTVSTHTSSSSFLDALFPDQQVHYPLPFDLIIVDLFLPRGMSGLETLQHIQRLTTTDRLGMVLISGASPGEINQAERALPTVPVLRKPFSLKALIQLMDTLQKRRCA